MLRQEAAHADSRPDLLPLVQQVREWISFAWGRDFGGEVDYHGTHLLPPKISGPAEAIANLDRVATGHPTKAVRQAARSLSDSIDGVYNTIDSGRSSEPGIEDFSRWLQSADALIEAMHLPASC